MSAQSPLLQEHTTRPTPERPAPDTGTRATCRLEHLRCWTSYEVLEGPPSAPRRVRVSGVTESTWRRMGDRDEYEMEGE